MAQGEHPSNPPDTEPSLVPKQPVAWNPLTPKGIAVFASATFQRLFVVQLMMGLLASGILIWFIFHACLPVVRAAILNLPDQGRVEDGQLLSPQTTPLLLAETRLLSLGIDPLNESSAGKLSDFQVELHRLDYQVCSLLGCLVLRYPPGWTMELNRKDLGPRLDAWGPMIWVLTCLATVVCLLVTWACLASLHAPVAWLIALYKDRHLSLAGSWRLAAAALMPGALMMCVGLVLYGLGFADLIRVAILVVLHFPAAWVFLVLATLRLPRASDSRPNGTNPFEPPSTTPKSENPFVTPQT